MPGAKLPSDPPTEHYKRYEARRVLDAHWDRGTAPWQRGALTDTALPVQCGLEARITRTLVGTNDVDAASVTTQVVAKGAFVDICGGKNSLSSQPC